MDLKESRVLQTTSAPPVKFAHQLHSKNTHFDYMHLVSQILVDGIQTFDNLLSDIVELPCVLNRVDQWCCGIPFVLLLLPSLVFYASACEPKDKRPGLFAPLAIVLVYSMCAFMAAAHNSSGGNSLLCLGKFATTGVAPLCFYTFGSSDTMQKRLRTLVYAALVAVSGVLLGYCAFVCRLYIQ